MVDILSKLEEAGLIPVVVMNDAARAVPTARAMLEGGIRVMEIALRTSQGMAAIRRVAAECPEMLVGGGTVLTLEQCAAAIDAGARFIVSPGFDPELVSYCLERGVLPCPGCVTPTEITAALKLGLTVVKFFPANIYGGLKAIKSLRGPFGMVRFIPTGGVNLQNLTEFRDSAILAVGGGWLCEPALIDSGRYDEITDICRASMNRWRQ